MSPALNSFIKRSNIFMLKIYNRTTILAMMVRQWKCKCFAKFGIVSSICKYIEEEKAILSRSTLLGNEASKRSSLAFIGKTGVVSSKHLDMAMPSREPQIPFALLI